MELTVFDEPRSVMLAFYLSESLANAISLPNGEAPEDLHLTVIYLGKFTELPLEEILTGLDELSQILPPLSGRISGIGRFNATETSEEQDVLYASFDSPDLWDLRNNLLIFVEKIFSIDESHGYTPHITLAYVDPSEDYEVNLPEIETEFSTLTLAVGDDYYDFELLGKPEPEAPPVEIPLVDRVTNNVISHGDKKLNDNVINQFSVSTFAVVGATPEQIAKINQFTPEQMEPLQPEEVVVVTFIGADNLLNRGLGKWDVRDLPILAALLPGLPLTLDHDWDEVSKTQGVIFEARVVVTYNQDNAVSSSKTDSLEIISRAGNFEWNRKIVAEEGYQACEFDVAFPATSPALQGLRFGQLSSISLGGFNYKDHICPLCKVSFSDKHCPHYIPEAWAGLTYDVDEQFAPYYIRSGVFDLGEASLVSIPNLPGATIKRRGLVAK